MMPRSWLFVPGDSTRKIEAALKGNADALIFDWEDAVSPANKGLGRSTTKASLAAASCDIERIWIRVNGLDTRWFADDLSALPADRIAGVVIPKCCGPSDLTRLDRELARCEAASGIAAGTMKVVAIATETAASVLALSEFRRPVPRLSGILWGGEDLAGDLGVMANRDASGRYRAAFQHARTMVLYAAAATQSLAIDAVNVDFRNLQSLEDECAEARTDGFVSKAAIHPAQVEVINAAFSATAEELAWARRVVQALPDGGVAVVDGKMVDAPHLRIARRILAR
ncbi:HpcH/HpaI aldolase/citrate lyase family protein [Pollutimonas thiosulfatoxidans]|nr:CoA ester lyase [Pollutimonas thiosulfatoxidans]